MSSSAQTQLLVRRSRQLNACPIQGDCIIYWMSRDQRVDNNHALVLAQSTALKYKLPLIVYFNVFASLGVRLKQQFQFMIDGLKEVEQQLNNLHIPLVVWIGDPLQNFAKILQRYQPAAIFFDFSPLRQSIQFKQAVAANSIACFDVDTHNIIPCWEASDKEEFAAYTFRPKYTAKLEAWLKPCPTIHHHPYQLMQPTEKVNWAEIDMSISAPLQPNYHLQSTAGTNAAYNTFNEFVTNKLPFYALQRNDPTKNMQSLLSPYLHFGQISSLSIALKLKTILQPELQENIAVFLEELLVRKELSENYCFYNPDYDQFNGLKPWAQLTLQQHINDPRHIYHLADLETAQTNDNAWNAAQIQLIRSGRMHGYMRMYWAKRLLEWTPDPQTAIEYAVYLNDKYFLDGFDPNGYTGILWSIGGLHDRAWFDRPIFGKIRYMNANGLKRKWQIDTYIAHWLAQR